MLGSWACTETQQAENDLACIWGGFLVDFTIIIIGGISMLYAYRYRQKMLYQQEMLQDRGNLLMFNAESQGATNWQQTRPTQTRNTGSLTNPLILAHDGVAAALSRDSSVGVKKSIFSFLKSTAKTPKELRLAMRMADADLPMHAYRLYLCGSNHPMESRGANSFTLTTKNHFYFYFPYVFFIFFRRKLEAQSNSTGMPKADVKKKRISKICKYFKCCNKVVR